MSSVYPKYKIVSTLLLAIFWIAGTYAYPLQELAPSVFSILNPYIYTVGEGLIFVLGLWTLRNRLDIILLSSLLIISLTSKELNGISFVTFANGMRQYLDLVFILCIIRYLLATRVRLEYFIPLFEKNLYAFLLLQFPVMVQQCFRWGAFDNVGGSLGWMMSGPISTLLYVISFYLMLRRWDYYKSYIANLKQNWILLVCLFPSMLNETKISFIYLVLYFVLLIPLGKGYMKKILYIAPLTGFIALGSIELFNVIQSRSEYANDIHEFSITDYVFGQEEMRTAIQDGTMEDAIPYFEEENIDLARGIKFASLPIVIQSSPHGLWFGFGPSQFKGGTVMNQTAFAKEFSWLLSGTTISLIMFQVDLGLLGVLWLLAYLYILFRAGKRIKKREWRLTLLVAIIFIINLFYMAPHQILPFMIIFIFIIMMSSRWSLNKYVPEPTGWLLYPLPNSTKEE